MSMYATYEATTYEYICSCNNLITANSLFFALKHLINQMFSFKIKSHEEKKC